jgi:hypothetical protein
MIHDTASMMFLTTRTETEALLLEQNLIKQLKPRYNVLLRDDKSFPNILVTRDHKFPMIKKHRGAKTEKGDYYGPFASAGAVNRTLNQLQKVFLLRNCSDAMFESRTRPCLLYQIKRCAAPCVGKVSQTDYAALIDDAEAFLKGKTTSVQADLATAPRLLARPLDAQLHVERLARRPAVDHAGRTPRTARIDTHAGIAVRHPFLRIDQFPVLVLVARPFEDLGRSLHQQQFDPHIGVIQQRQQLCRARTAGAQGAGGSLQPGARQKARRR